MTDSTWEDGLGNEDEDAANNHAKESILAEAHRRAQRVVEHENARENPRPMVIDNAQASADILEQAMGMWKH